MAESSACESSEAAIKGGGGLQKSLEHTFYFWCEHYGPVHCFERNKQHYLKGFSFTFPIEWINWAGFTSPLFRLIWARTVHFLAHFWPDI